MYQFDCGELQKNKEAVLGNFGDTIDNDRTVPDPGVVNKFIEANKEFSNMYETLANNIHNHKHAMCFCDKDFKQIV